MSIIDLKISKYLVEKLQELDCTGLEIPKSEAKVYEYIINNLANINHIMRRYHGCEITVKQDGTLLISQYMKEPTKQND